MLLGEAGPHAEWRGTVAGVGDLVQARALAWHLRGFEGNTAAPITQRTYRVLDTRADGGLTVAPIVDRDGPDRNVWGERLGEPMQLPAATSASTSPSATPRPRTAPRAAPSTPATP